MSEGSAPRGNRTDTSAGRTKWFRGRSDRMAMAVLTAILAITPVLGTTALAGSGGIGGGGGGGGGNGGGDSRYERMWDKMSDREHRWAHRTSNCESGGNPHIHGGGGSYHGAFQFMKATWKHSPKSPGGDPHKYSWKTQAVVAIKLKNRDGAGHWPNCG